ncbi:aldo/keto reductase [Jiangella rhizosphaerae]|uniref:aldo/keto reductase n=1 Tax=Jiangella rhizosphaerae TaxID=2293569 RepID=UPI0018F6A49C|nr:aldo/keto reductase [Jiangella rhizosphaerae]
MELTWSRLGFGAAPIAGLYTAVDPDTAAATVDAAWDAGVRYFDTAPHYGLGVSERRLGAALAGRDRDAYVVSTKAGRLLVPGHGDGSDDEASFAVPATHRRVWDLSRDGIRRSLDDSLTRLGLDRVDILYLHDPEERLDEALATALPALAELRDDGAVRAIGAGSKDAAALARLVRSGGLDVVMVAGRYTLLEQPALDDLFPACAAAGTDVVAAGVFNSGLLAAPQPDPGSTYEYGAVPPEVLDRARALAAVCAEHDAVLPQAALQFRCGTRWCGPRSSACAARTRSPGTPPG